MVSVVLENITVHGVYPCPKCGSEKYASIHDIPLLVQMACDKCDYVASGAIYARGFFEGKAYIELTRKMFNMWNTSVATENNIKTKNVRITKNK